MAQNLIRKISLLGDSFVDKTSIKKRYLGFEFEFGYLATIGDDFSIKEMEYKKTKIKFMIWNLSGQEQYFTVKNGYYLGSRGIILVYDIK